MRVRDDGRLELDDGRWVLWERRLDPGRSAQRLVGLEFGLCGSCCSKKLEVEALVFKVGVEGKFNNVSVVLSARDGRIFVPLTRVVSLPVPSSFLGL